MGTTDEGAQGARSELHIQNTSITENGTYYCSARNKAGKVSSRYVLNIALEINPNIVMEVGKKQFVCLVILLVMVLMLVMVILMILLWMMTMVCQHNESEDII